MTRTRRIDMEEYATRGLELLLERREEYVDYALYLLSEGLSPGIAGERLERRLKGEMEDVLFDFLKRSGTIRGEYIHRYTYGYCITSRRKPRKSEVSPELLDIERILPDYEAAIGNIMADAEKRWIEAEADRFAKEANEDE